LDADDAWLPQKVEREVAILATRPDVAVVYSGLRVTNKRLEPLYDVPPPEPSQVLRNVLLLQPPVLSTAQAVLIRTEAFHAAGGFDESMSMCADADLACRLALSFVIESTGAPLVLYRLHGAQMSHDPSALERDGLALFRSAFADTRLPEDVRALSKLAHANLFSTLAIGYARREERTHTRRCLVQAMRYAPVASSVRLARIAATRLGSRGAGPRIPPWGKPVDLVETTLGPLRSR
jgi:GT2 family glycosyltransferase